MTQTKTWYKVFWYNKHLLVLFVDRLSHISNLQCCVYILNSFLTKIMFTQTFKTFLFSLSECYVLLIAVRAFCKWQLLDTVVAANNLQADRFARKAFMRQKNLQLFCLLLVDWLIKLVTEIMFAVGGSIFSCFTRKIIIILYFLAQLEKPWT